MIISSSGLDQPWWPDCNYRLSASLLCCFILSIHPHFQAVQRVGCFSLQLKSSRSPEASVTAVSQAEFAIPWVAFITVVQTPSSEKPIWGQHLILLPHLTPWGQSWKAHCPLHIFSSDQHRAGLVISWNGCSFPKCSPHTLLHLTGWVNINKGNEWVEVGGVKCSPEIKHSKCVHVCPFMTGSLPVLDPLGDHGTVSRGAWHR